MKNNHKLKIFCLLFALTATISGCKKNDVVSDEKGLNGNKKNLAWGGDPQYNLLGYGYDVTGRLANAESSRLQVINIKKYVDENSSLYRYNDDVYESFDYSSGENAESYSTSMAQKYSATASFLKLFKAELNASFDKKSSYSSKYSYASVRKMIKQKNLKIYYTTDNLITNYLTDQFRSDLNTLSPSDLIFRYGTHVLTDIELGARLDMNYEAQTNSSQKEEAAKAGAVLSAAKIFSVKADISTNNSYASSNFNQTLYYNTVGGDGTKPLVGTITLDNTAIKLSIAEWQSTCTKDNAALIKIGKEGFIPLQDLIADPVKKQQVKDAIERYIADRQVKELGEMPVYVYYSSEGKDHYFSLNNQPNLGNGYFKNEGIVFYAFNKPTAGCVPVYVYYNSGSADHYYGLGNSPTIGNGTFRNQGIAFYAYPKNTPNTAPVYMYYNSKDSDHYITPNNSPTIGNGTFLNEGVVFNVPL
ncbi:MAC/perforin domain-containing protein [Pedobacter sp. MW01-1-1]|uniref:MAC/perforin domain-containing protein n=1 Tax=Pedobacter sp. MW01-1-1 TaxID=3383027 RepID=UPI003FF0D150